MIRKYTLRKIIVFVLCAVMLNPLVPVNNTNCVYAKAADTFSSTKKTMVCGRQATIKLPSGYSKAKFSSSNRKVATVTSKGVVKAVRLGVAKITVKSGKKTKTYTITVKPEKASDVRLNQETVLVGQKLQFQLISDRYDTSQVKLTFSCAYSEVAGNGLCKGIRSPGWGSLDYSYGSFKKSTRLTVYSPENIVNEILTGEWYGEPDLCEIYAGTSYKVGVSSDLDEGEKLTPSKLRKQGISLLLDGEPMPDSVVYTAGKHVIEVASGSISYKKEINVTYNVKDVLIKKDAVGYAPECKEVFDKAFSIVDQIITEGMSEDDKVKAIHDYLIYHADYVNNGDYSSAENWAYGASGVLLHGEGVCQSYAFAFYMMATAAGLECEVVSGQATNSTGSTGGHAWNRVKVNGTWYYIDCTWDDPVGGGYERYDYYLSKNGWSNHIIEESKDLALDGKYYWEHYYLTGKDY